jgi:hypothetical protein
LKAVNAGRGLVHSVGQSVDRRLWLVVVFVLVVAEEIRRLPSSWPPICCLLAAAADGNAAAAAVASLMAKVRQSVLSSVRCPASRYIGLLVRVCCASGTSRFGWSPSSTPPTAQWRGNGALAFPSSGSNYAMVPLPRLCRLHLVAVAGSSRFRAGT